MRGLDEVTVIAKCELESLAGKNLSFSIDKKVYD